MKGKKMYNRRASIERVAATAMLMKNAGPLTDVRHLRFQAIFMMGAPGSGKGSTIQKYYTKYMPDQNGGIAKYQDKKLWEEKTKVKMTEQERGLTNLKFEEVKEKIEKLYGFKIELDGSNARIPFRLYDYDEETSQERLIPESEWSDLPDDIKDEVMGLKEVVFNTPVHELPTYWRVVDPDQYKKELHGYMEKEPGYVHEMSSEMSKAYFEAAVKTGDPLIVDGTGGKAAKYLQQIETARKNGYKITLIWVYVPLVANIIRNSTRKRVVNTNEVTRLFKKMPQTWKAVSSQVDKAKIETSFTENGFDKKNYLANKDKINNFISQHTDGEFNTVYEYLTKSREVPQSEAKLAKKLKWLQG